MEKHQQSGLLILDEIHKSKNWKQKLKGFYDINGAEIDMIMTGSARLNVFKEGGDSMMGRCLNFRMHPLSYAEVSGHEILEPEAWLGRILKLWRQGRIEKIVREDLRDLSRLIDLGQIEALVSILPERVGSSLSIQAIRKDVEVSFDSVKRWMSYLSELFYFLN